jgi:hypothetical protein
MAERIFEAIVVTNCNTCPNKTAKKREAGKWVYYCAALGTYRAIDPATIPADCPLPEAP